MFLTILLFLTILSVLIFVHEWGHYTMARRNGMRVYEFGFGFPPRLGGIVWDESLKKWRFIWGNRHYHSDKTIYSINWIPLGGFVKIKGEDGGSELEPDSFAAKSALSRIEVLVAGVAMNFVLAWVLLSLVFMLGAREEISDERAAVEGAMVIVSGVLPGSPAEKMNLRMGDEVVSVRTGEKVTLIRMSKDLQNIVATSKGKEVTMEIKRGSRTMELSGTPRVDYPKTEGPLGVQMAQVSVVKYPWYQAPFRGAQATYQLTGAILGAFGKMIATLFAGQGVTADVAGPVGIAYLTKQVSDMGFTYVLQFAALLSINLGIINVLPIPGLDGGRLLFVLIEVLKGSPVSRKFEQTVHAVGFIALISLMVLVTFHDFAKFEILQKIMSLF